MPDTFVIEASNDTTTSTINVTQSVEAGNSEELNGSLVSTSTTTSLDGISLIGSVGTQQDSSSLIGTSASTSSDWQVSVEESASDFSMETDTTGTSDEFEMSEAEGGSEFHMEEASPEADTEIKVETAEPPSDTSEGSAVLRDSGPVIVAVPDADTTLVFDYGQQRDTTSEVIAGPSVFEAQADPSTTLTASADVDTRASGGSILDANGSTTETRSGGYIMIGETYGEDERINDELVFIAVAPEIDTTLVYEAGLGSGVSDAEISAATAIESRGDLSASRDGAIILETGTADSRLAIADDFIFG